MVASLGAHALPRLDPTRSSMAGVAMTHARPGPTYDHNHPASWHAIALDSAYNNTIYGGKPQGPMTRTREETKRNRESGGRMKPAANKQLDRSWCRLDIDHLRLVPCAPRDT